MTKADLPETITLQMVIAKMTVPELLCENLLIAGLGALNVSFLSTLNYNVGILRQKAQLRLQFRRE